MWKCFKNVLSDIFVLILIGNDLDEVEVGGKGVIFYLFWIGVKLGILVEGFVILMFEGKFDIDLNSIVLFNE